VRPTTGTHPVHLLLTDNRTWVVLPAPKPNLPQFIQLAFARPYYARMLALLPGPGMQGASEKIEASDDGTSFRSLQSFALPNGVAKQMIAFPPVAARFYRVLLTSLHPGMKQFSIAAVELLPRLGIDNLIGKAFYGRSGD
jgi:hypothetical protein